MGDRAFVIVTNTNRTDVSPVIYLHWLGGDVPKLVKQWAKLMDDRKGDVAYAAARFVGICHENQPGNLSLGMWEGSQRVLDDPKNNNPGDNGIYILNADDFSYEHVEAY